MLYVFMQNLKFPKLEKDESFEFFASFETGQQIEVKAVEKFISNWFNIYRNEEIFGRLLKEEFLSEPKAKLQDEILVLRFLGAPSGDCRWSDRRWKDWFTKLASELLEGQLEITKLLWCNSEANI